jgi:hypothetical protein
MMAEDLLREVLNTLRGCGRGRDECVVLGTGPVDAPRVVDAIVHPVHVASPRFYEIDGAWLTSFWVLLARERRAIRMQIHTHGGVAFHSETDDAWPIIQTVGFLSLVLPDHAARDDLSGAFLARLSEEGTFDEVPISELEVIA